MDDFDTEHDLVLAATIFVVVLGLIVFALLTINNLWQYLVPLGTI